MLRPRLIRIPQRAAAQLRPKVPSRSQHTVPVLNHFPDGDTHGVPGLLMPPGFSLGWTQNMHLMINKLNSLVVGTEYEQMPVRDIIVQTARQPHEAPIFNHASMAFNNAFFFENLVNHGDNPNPVFDESAIPERLRRTLEAQFSSIETLRREFMATANAMFGPGFVWLVKNAQTDEFRLLVTYLAGTPFTAAHWRRQGFDANTRGSDVDNDIIKEGLARTQVGAGNRLAGQFTAATAPGGTDTIPVLCLNTWDHVWLPDYGLGATGQGGKRLYVENWWKCIDWSKVDTLARIGNNRGVKQFGMERGA